MMIELPVVIFGAHGKSPGQVGHLWTYEEVCLLDPKTIVSLAQTQSTTLQLLHPHTTRKSTCLHSDRGLSILTNNNCFPLQTMPCVSLALPDTTWIPCKSYIPTLVKMDNSGLWGQIDATFDHNDILAGWACRKNSKNAHDPNALSQLHGETRLCKSPRNSVTSWGKLFFTANIATT